MAPRNTNSHFNSSSRKWNTYIQQDEVPYLWLPLNTTFCGLQNKYVGHPKAAKLLGSVTFWGVTWAGRGRRLVFPFLLSFFVMLPVLFFVLFAFLLLAFYFLFLLSTLHIRGRARPAALLFLFWKLLLVARWWIRSK